MDTKKYYQKNSMQKKDFSSGNGSFEKFNKTLISLLMQFQKIQTYVHIPTLNKTVVKGFIYGELDFFY